MKSRILIVEDDSTIAMTLQDRLQNEGYTTVVAGDGTDGFQKAINGKWDLIILDLMLPGKDGLELCRDIRAKGIDTPVLMLTAREQTVDKVVGLKMGADDYLTKPFEMIELLARIEALLRRRPENTPDATGCRLGSYFLDFRRQELRKKGKITPLTTYEYKLLRYLCEHRGEVLDRDELLTEVWGYDETTYTRTMDTHIGLLRKKLGDSKKQELIITIRGQGYKLI